MERSDSKYQRADISVEAVWEVRSGISQFERENSRGCGAHRAAFEQGQLLGRVEIKDDKDAALKLQQAFKASVLGSPKVKAPPAIRMFDNKDLMGVQIFNEVDTTLASALDVAPNAAPMQQKVRAVAAYAASNQQARTEVDAQSAVSFRNSSSLLLPRARPIGIIGSAAARSAIMAPITSSGRSQTMRASGPTRSTRWSISSPRAIPMSKLSTVPTATSCTSPHKLPERVIDAFWSVILVGVPDYRVVPNPLNRFHLNNFSLLTKEFHGSLKIAIGPKPVAGVAESNRLPSPEGKPFSLTFRTYVPKEIVKRGEWTPLPVTKVN